STNSRICSNGWTNEQTRHEGRARSFPADISRSTTTESVSVVTQPHLIEKWLMKNEKPTVDHRFNLRGDWDGVLDCEVVAVEPHKTSPTRGTSSTTMRPTI